MLLLLSCLSCQKKVSDPLQENNQKAAAFKSYLVQNSKFRLVDFYAESPIDYDKNDDGVTMETDLKKYIRHYLIDDDIIFNSNGNVTFVQHTVKIGNNDDEEVTMPFNTRGDYSGVLVDFADDLYQPFTYYLYEKGDTYFILGYKRPNENVWLLSRYEMVL